VSQYTFPSTKKVSSAWARLRDAKQKMVAMRTATAKVFAILPPLGVIMFWRQLESFIKERRKIGGVVNFVW
jgi:hypothetical protein